MRSLILLFILSSCGSPYEWEVAHPAADRLPQEVDFSVDITETSTAILPILPHPNSIVFEKEIGDRSAIEDEFYRVSNVVLGDDGRTYIKHFHSNSIRVYDSNGRFEYVIGRGGRGPGEFTRIGSFRLDLRNQLLYVIDEHGAKIEVFEKKQDRFTYSRSIFHKYSMALDLCMLGDDLFVSGESLPMDTENGKLQNAGPISRIDPMTGNVEHTFGFSYPTKSSRFDMTLSNSLLSCNENTNTVIAYSMYFPYIIGYSPEGVVKWRSTMDGFASWEFIEFKSSENKNPGMLFFTNIDIFNYKFPTQNIPIGEYSLLQFGWTGPVMNRIPAPNPPIRSEDKEPRTRTILVNSGTGELLYSDVYPPIGDIRDGRMVTYEILEPYQIRFSINMID